MPKRRFRLSISGGLFAAAASLLALGAGAVPAAQAVATASVQAAPPAVSQAGPDYTCPSRTLCLFQDNNYSGNVAPYYTPDYGGEWINISSSLSLPFGAFNDNSGSSVVFYNASAGAYYCFPASSRHDYSEGGSFIQVFGSRYFYLEYGIGDCTGHYPNAP